MIQIEKIEIKYFRSIYAIVIKDLKDITIFSGKNDCGKSNILRAVNLFFNNQTGWKEDPNFDRDFCRKRLNQCRNTVKAKQFIQIKVHFIRGDRYEKSLPEKFWVARTWNRDSTTPAESDSLREGKIPAKSLDRAQASLQKYVRSIRFEYVPAVKDRSFFNYSLGILQEAILESKQDESFAKAVDGLNTTVKSEAQLLHEEFASVSGVDVEIHLPDSLADLFRAFAVSTGGKDGFPLSVRGDGIQARFLPSLIHHVATKSKKRFIWGFEEPENCLEHGLATKLASDIVSLYSNESQILITSHSPAFITLVDPKTSVRRAHSEEGETKNDIISSGNESLADDLGLIALQRHYQANVLAELEVERKAREAVDQLLVDKSRPILLVEGKTDVLILNKAWSILNDPHKSLPFRITSVDVAGSHETESKAGVGILRIALESCRLDNSITVGLFDYDDEGLAAFALNKNFVADSADPNLKVGANRHVAGICIPEITGKEFYRKAYNLPIEFIFPENCIIKQIGSRGLVLRQKSLEIKIGKHTVEQKTTTEPHYRKIDDGKAYFAEHIVPTFTKEDFNNFIPLFKLINKAFSRLI